MLLPGDEGTSVVKLATETVKELTAEPVSVQALVDTAQNPQGTQTEKIQPVLLPENQQELASEDGKTTEQQVTVDSAIKEQLIPTHKVGLERTDSTAVVKEESEQPVTKTVPALEFVEPVAKPAPAKLLPGTGFRSVGMSRSATSSGVIGDDYPAKWKHLDPNTNTDDWGMYVRYCTSFVAHRLSSTNGFELPRAYGNAEAWGRRARTEGYRVDNNPSRGSVAWLGPAPSNLGYGHVAWVAGVNGDMVTIEEYNGNWDFKHQVRTVHKTAFTGYIHFKDIAVPKPTVNQPPKGNIIVQNHNTQTGDFEVLITDVANGGGVREVKVPIWSDKGGQDDIVWYQAEQQDSGTYKVAVKASNHRLDTGDYHIHLYYTQDNGQLVGVSGRTFKVQRGQEAKSQVNLTIEKQGDSGHFNILLSQVSHTEDVQEILVPTWTDKDGQDDIVWYKAARQSDGTYQVAVNLSKHKGEVGLYHVHAYIKQYNGKLIGVANHQVTVERSLPQTGGRVAVTQKGNGQFDVVISDLSHTQEIAEVMVPIWSDKAGQDDIVWYRATKQSTGDYRVSVDSKGHKGDSGLYHIHLYVKQADGQLVGAGETRTEVGAVSSTPLPQAGTYHFTSKTPIKTQASLSSTTVAHYQAGQSVNYDRIVTAEGRQWLSYISYSGARRYIALP